MANPDQKTILLEQAYDELKAICTKFQNESGATDMEVKTLLRELARVYEKDIDDNYDIDWEVSISLFDIFCYKLIEAKPRQHTLRLLQDIN